MVWCGGTLFVLTLLGGHRHLSESFPLLRYSGMAAGAVPLYDLLGRDVSIDASPKLATPAAMLRYDIELKGAKKHIEHMDDFRGFLRIDSAAKAISFVRIGDYCCDYPTVSPGFSFQEIWHGPLYQGLKFPEGESGWVKGSTWRRLGLKDPAVTRRNGYWSVVRPVVIELDPGPQAPDSAMIEFKPYIIHENVSDDGGYRLVSKRVLRGKLARKVVWRVEWGE